MPSKSRIGAWVFASALTLQGLHMIEHFAQLYQYVLLRLPISESRGILFFLDLEQNHFYFNFLYFLLLFYSFIKLRFFDKNKFSGLWMSVGRYSFSAGLALQGYHVLEHTARIGQYIQTNCTPCKGILGWYFNGIYLHFTLNTLTLVLPAIGFFACKIYRELGRKKTEAVNAHIQEA